MEAMSSNAYRVEVLVKASLNRMLSSQPCNNLEVDPLSKHALVLRLGSTRASGLQPHVLYLLSLTFIATHLKVFVDLLQ